MFTCSTCKCDPSRSNDSTSSTNQLNPIPVREKRLTRKPKRYRSATPPIDNPLPQRSTKCGPRAIKPVAGRSQVRSAGQTLPTPALPIPLPTTILPNHSPPHPPIQSPPTPFIRSPPIPPIQSPPTPLIRSPPIPPIQSPPTPLIRSPPIPPMQSPPTPLMQSTPTPLIYSPPTPLIQSPPNPPMQSPFTLLDLSNLGEEPSTRTEMSTRYPSPIPVEEVSMVHPEPTAVQDRILKYEIVSEGSIKGRSTLLDGLG